MRKHRSIFPYPGGKTRKADWITRTFPDHDLYAEPFGGSAAVLFSKDPSPIEVYNDRDEELVHFFEILRDRPDDLIAWIDGTPYSRSLHERYRTAFYDSDPADEFDDVERAGVFWYLRYTQFGRKYHGKSGFATSKTRNEARTYDNARDAVSDFADRFSEVLIECLDWEDVLEKYDREDALFYIDAPYLGTESNYLVDDFSHTDLAEALPSIDGMAVVSYQEIPPAFDADDWFVLERADHNHMGSARDGSDAKDVTERLLLNFDPNAPGARKFEGTPQSGLGDWST